MINTHHISIRSVLKTLLPMKVIGFDKCRIGGPHDGGYVMLDNFPAELRCLSLGIGGDVSWDLEMANRGAIVHQYDHTVEAPPVSHPHFRFHKIKIGGIDDSASMTRSLAASASELLTPDTLAILKMDIEDSEWDVLSACPASTISHFDQMVIEFHGLHRLSSMIECQSMKSVFAKLRLTHFPVHVHANNWGAFHAIEGIPIPDVLEITFASRKNYLFLSSDEIYPNELDFPCNEFTPEIFLGSFRF